MSSHHIVKEKQEPALYIHHLGEFNEEYLGQLLEWSPTLIVNALEYEKVLSLGLKTDVVLNPDPEQQYQENTRVIKGNRTDIADVINYLIVEKYPAVNIIDKDSNLDAIQQFIHHINLVVFTPTTKSYGVKSGFKVWKPKGTQFEIPLTTYFETSNLIPNENGLFEVDQDGFVEFIFGAEYLFITERL
jgi:hypothetical protein